MSLPVLTSDFSAFSVPGDSKPGPARISIKDADGNTVFSNDYAQESWFNVFGLGDVIADHLMSRGASSGRYSVKASRIIKGSGAGSFAGADAAHVVASYDGVFQLSTYPVGASTQFLESSFLLQGRLLRLPLEPAIEMPVPLWSDGEDNMTEMSYWTEPADDPALPAEVKSSRTIHDIPDGFCNTPKASADDFRINPQRRPPFLSVFSCGARQLVIEWIPQDSSPTGAPFLFRFTNSFGQKELLALYGPLSVSPKTEADTVAVAGRLRRLDIQPQPEFTVSAGSLSYSEARLFAFLQYSHSVELLEGPDLRPQPVIVTGAAGDIADDPLDMSSFKLTFRFADRRTEPPRRVS